MTVVFAGLTIGAIYTLVAIGYNILFISAGVFNFAQAQLVMLGTFFAYVGAVTLGLPTIPTVLLAIAAVALIGVVEERIAIRPIRDRGAHSELVTTIGAAVLADGIAYRIWGPNPRAVPWPATNDPVTILGGRILPSDLVLIFVAVAVALAAHVLYRHTTVGLASLAASADREAAMLRGINVRWLSIGAFAVAGAVSGGVGLVVGNHTYAVYNLGDSLAVISFVALVIGGVGSHAGALVGGLLTGVMSALGARWFGVDYPPLIMFGVLAFVLLVRPTGIFGHRAERVI